jgi:hypothetical protein
VHRIAGALFLNSFVLSADPIEGRTTLQHAREHVLNVSHMAVITAEHTIKSVPDDLPSSVEGPLPDLSKRAEILLVRSIEWTVIGLDTYDMALEQVSVILRYLLGARLLLFFFFGGICDCILAFFDARGRTNVALCSSTCYLWNWLLSARLRRSRQSAWIIAHSLLFGDTRAHDRVLGTRGTKETLGHEGNEGAARSERDVGRLSRWCALMCIGRRFLRRTKSLGLHKRGTKGGEV